MSSQHELANLPVHQISISIPYTVIAVTSALKFTPNQARRGPVLQIFQDPSWLSAALGHLSSLIEVISFHYIIKCILEARV